MYKVAQKAPDEFLTDNSFKGEGKFHLYSATIAAYVGVQSCPQLNRRSRTLVCLHTVTRSPNLSF